MAQYVAVCHLLCSSYKVDKVRVIIYLRISPIEHLLPIAFIDPFNFPIPSLKCHYQIDTSHTLDQISNQPLATCLTFSVADAVVCPLNASP